MRSRVAGGLVTAIALLVFFGLRSQVALLRSGRSAGIKIFSGHKAEKYTGWKLADQEFEAYVDPKKARVVFYIMVAGLQELPGLDALLRNVYHVDHFFLVHLDVKAAAHVREGVKRRILQVLDERGNGQVNIRLVDPATPITWGGFTMTLNAVHGITQALHWTTKWDYFINLSATDLPLLGTDEVAGILGEHKASNTSFIKGFKYEPSWEGYQFIDRREMFAEDQAVMRDTDTEKRWPWAILDAQKEKLTRPMPNLFTVHKGEFWVMLHRSMAEYVHKSPDNQARTLLAYFSGMIVSDEEFFQTVACNPHFPHATLRTHDDNLRFVNWWGDQASPAIVPPFRAVAAANSGAMFGRKFSSSTDEGRDGIRWIESYLADSSRSQARVDRVKRRLAARMTPEGKAVGFCGKAQEKKPPEAYYAVEGDEEKLPEEFQDLPPRRGGGAVGEEQRVAWQDQTGEAVKDEAAAAAAAGGGGGGGGGGVGKQFGGEGGRRLSEMAPVDPPGMRVAETPREWQHHAAEKMIGGGVQSRGGAETSARRYDIDADKSAEIVSPAAKGVLSGVGWSSGRRQHRGRRRRSFG